MPQEALADGVRATVGSRSLLRRMNSWGILRAVMARPQTIRALSAGLGLSRTATDAVVADLVELGWLTAAEHSPAPGPGRPASSYRPDPELGRFLSIDIGANHIYAVVTDVTGAVAGHRAAATDENVDASERLATALSVADDLLDDLGLDRSALWTVAIGSPGVIDAAGKVRHFGGSGMPGWIGLNLRETFREEFDSAVLVEGDVALGAHAELTIGAARGHADVVYVLCGARTSGASIVNGHVHRGVHGAAGIVGEMAELRWADLNERYGSGVLGTPRPSREEIFDRARAGDPAARAAVDEFADDLATGAAALTLALDPELLVIGGGSSPSADVFLPRFTETLGRLCPIAPTIAASTLGSEAVAMGGISLALDHLGSVLEATVRESDAFPSPNEARDLLRRSS